SSAIALRHPSDVCIVVLLLTVPLLRSFLFFFTDTPPTEIYTLSLHDALPILHRHANDRARLQPRRHRHHLARGAAGLRHHEPDGDRKSTRLNSSHRTISYAVFCLKKKKKKKKYNKKS